MFNNNDNKTRYSRSHTVSSLLDRGHGSASSESPSAESLTSSSVSAPADSNQALSLPFYKKIILKGLHHLLDYYKSQYSEPEFEGIACLKRNFIFELNRIDNPDYEELFDHLENRLSLLLTDNYYNNCNQLDNVIQASKSMLYWLRQFSPIRDHQLREEDKVGITFNKKFKNFRQLYCLSSLLVPDELLFGLGSKKQSELNANPADYCISRLILDYVVIKRAETIANHFAPTDFFAKGISYLTHKAQRLIDDNIDNKERLKEQLVVKNILALVNMKQTYPTKSQLTDNILEHLSGMIHSSYYYESNYSQWKQSIWSSEASTSRLVSLLRAMYNNVSLNYECHSDYKPQV